MADNENMVAQAAESASLKQEKADKKTEDKPKKDKPGFWARTKKWCKEMVAELKKVTWPTWKQTMNNTLIVLAFCVVIGLCIFVFDKLAGGILNALVHLFHR